MRGRAWRSRPPANRRSNASRHGQELPHPDPDAKVGVARFLIDAGRRCPFRAGGSGRPPFGGHSSSTNYTTPPTTFTWRRAFSRAGRQWRPVPTRPRRRSHARRATTVRGATSRRDVAVERTIEGRAVQAPIGAGPSSISTLPFGHRSRQPVSARPARHPYPHPSAVHFGRASHSEEPSTVVPPRCRPYRSHRQPSRPSTVESRGRRARRKSGRLPGESAGS